jgi:hypothetical protein
MWEKASSAKKTFSGDRLVETMVALDLFCDGFVLFLAHNQEL